MSVLDRIRTQKLELELKGVDVTHVKLSGDAYTELVDDVEAASDIKITKFGGTVMGLYMIVFATATSNIVEVQ